MNEEYSFHKICLAAVFLFGNISLFIPYGNARNGELSAIILSAAVSVGLYFLWYFLADKTYNLNENIFWTKIIYIVLIVLSFSANTIISQKFIEYISDEVLIKNIKISILFVFAAICIYLVSKEAEVVAKISYISFVFIIITILVLFVISFKNFEPADIKELFCGKVVKRGGMYFLKAFWFPALYAFFSRFAFINKSIKNDIIGLIIGSALVIICFLSAVLTFSLKFASDLDFAYPISISVINIGELYTRMDGFAYFIFFLSALVKSSIFGFTIKMLMERLNAKAPFKTTALIMSASFAVSFIF